MSKKKPKKRKSRKKVCNVVKDLLPLIVPIDSIIEDPNNARVHNARNLKVIEGSLIKYKQRTPLVVNRLTKVISKGNGTWTVAKRLKWTHIAVVWVEDDPNADIGYKLVDNRSAELAKWDLPTLHGQLEILEAADFDIEITGFTQKEVLGEIGGGDGGVSTDPEIEFTDELLMEHNYIVLYFDNVLDWEVAKEKFGLKVVKDLIPRKGQATGVGRVIPGADVLERIK